MDDPERHLLGNLLETTLADDDAQSDRSRRRSFTYPSAVHDLGVAAPISPSSRSPAAGAHQLWSVERTSVPMFNQTSTSPPPSASAQEFYWKESHQQTLLDYYSQQQQHSNYTSQYASSGVYVGTPPGSTGPGQQENYVQWSAPKTNISSTIPVQSIAQQLAYVQQQQQQQQNPYNWHNSSLPPGLVDPRPSPPTSVPSLPTQMTAKSSRSHFPPHPPLGNTGQTNQQSTQTPVTGITIQNMSTGARVPVATVGPMPSYSSVASKRPTAIAAKITGSVTPTIRKASVDSGGGAKMTNSSVFGDVEATKYALNDAGAPVSLTTNSSASDIPRLVSESLNGDMATTPPAMINQRSSSGTSSTNQHAACGQMKTDFTKIKKGTAATVTGNKKAVGKTTSVQRNTKPSATMFAAQLIDNADDEGLNVGGRSRFQLLAEAKGKHRRDESVENDEDDDDDDEENNRRSLSETKSVSQTGAGKKASVTGGSKTGSASKAGGRAGGKGRHRNAQTPNALVVFAHSLGIIAVAVFEYVHYALCWLRDLFLDVFVSIGDITYYAVRSLCTATMARHRDGQPDVGMSSNEPISRWQRYAQTFTYWLLFKWAWKSTQNSADSNSDWGVPANIDLPTTGDEAISRLHNCRSRDAYSILGLRHDCTDEDIKRHYRRQAVLVHPDKVGVFCSEFPLQAFAQNCTAGADEAFKILAAAFELISTPERRLAYNAQNLHRRDDVRQLHELMQMLSKRMEEALSTMHCDCGTRHRRYAVASRTQSAARYCQRCEDRHPAKDNDIWAETRMFGFLWYYYVCVGGVVYDITEWAGCSHNQLKHMKANSHTVQYRLMSLRAGGGAGASGDGSVDELLSRLAQAAAAGSGGGGAHCSSSTGTDGLGALFSGVGAAGTGAEKPRSGRPTERATNQTATYQPPERADDSRPRKANARRRKVK